MIITSAPVPKVQKPIPTVTMDLSPVEVLIMAALIGSNSPNSLYHCVIKSSDYRLNKHRITPTKYDTDNFLDKGYSGLHEILKYSQ